VHALAGYLDPSLASVFSQELFHNPLKEKKKASTFRAKGDLKETKRVNTVEAKYMSLACCNRDRGVSCSSFLSLPFDNNYPCLRFSANTLYFFSLPRSIVLSVYFVANHKDIFTSMEQ